MTASSLSNPSKLVHSPLIRSPAAIAPTCQATILGCEFQISEAAGGLTLALSTIGAATPNLLLRASIASQTAAATEMAIAQKAGLGDLPYLNNGEILDISRASSCANTNTYAFIKLDLSSDAAGSSLFSIAAANGIAIPVANTDTFRAAIRNNLAAGFLVAQGGNSTTSHTWTVASGTGFYAPVMLSQNGDVFFISSFNADGQQHIKPVGDGAFSFENLSGASSDFDYNYGVLRISRRVAASSESRSNVFLYAHMDTISLGAGQDRVHILSGSSDNNIDLGVDLDADRVYFYRPTAGQGLSYLINFDPSLDTISLVNLDSTSSTSFSIAATKATLLVDSKPMLELIGSFSVDRLNAAIHRSDRGVGDAMAAIAERGLLVTEMISGLPATSQQRSDGQWFGYNVDIARAISEQLTGNADALAIRPNQSLLAGLNNVRDGYADLGLLGSTSTLSRDVNLGIDFSQPYLVDMQSFLVLGLKSAAELAGKTIGVIAGSTAKDNALAFLSGHGIAASVTEYATSTALSEALRSAANIGFSALDASGSLQGVDADIARALAIAKLNFVTNLPFSSTFAAVANGEVDLALRASSANLWRDGSFGVDFSDSYLTKGLKVLSHSSLGISRIDQLNGTSIGVIQGTTAAQNLKLALSKTGEAARIVTYANATELYNAFRGGAVESIARDGALLAGFQQQLIAEENPIATTMLNDLLSYEPFAAVVHENQSTFLDLVNGVIAILKQAAELGVTSANINHKLADAHAANAPAALRQLFQLNANATLSSIGITTERFSEIILAVGNIDQIVERSIVNPHQNTLARSAQMQRPL